jgi:flagellar hook-associated protein 3 FlgL
MIDLSNQMIYRIGNLNTENERISYQMSTGKILENGSDDSVLYARYLDVENKLRDQEGLLEQIDKTVAQNNVSDSVVAEAKTTLENIKTDLLRGLNSGMTRSDREAVATNISGMRENLIRLANTQIDGEYIYAGSNTTKQTFVKDDDFVINGKIDFAGNSHLRDISVGVNTQRERGVPGTDIFMYNTDTSAVDDAISFTENETVVDEHGYNWRFLQQSDVKATNDGTATSSNFVKGDFIYNDDNNGVNGADDTFYRAKVDLTGVDLATEDFSDTSRWEAFNPKDQIFKINEDESVGTEYLNIASTNAPASPVTYTTETIANAQTNSRIEDRTASGMLLEAKHSIFEDLNVIINALNGYKTKREDGVDDGKTDGFATDDEVRDILSGYLEKVDNQYSATNIGHAELGGRNKVFETYHAAIESKITHYNILIQETNGADMAKLAMESKSLEITYNALFSTVAKMNQLSLVNFIK